MAGVTIDFGRKPAGPVLAPLGGAMARLRARFAVAPGPLVAVGARRDGSGWTVQLLQQGEVVSLLSAGEARLLARELADMADVIEGKVP